MTSLIQNACSVCSEQAPIKIHHSLPGACACAHTRAHTHILSNVITLLFSSLCWYMFDLKLKGYIRTLFYVSGPGNEINLFLKVVYENIWPSYLAVIIDYFS